MMHILCMLECYVCECVKEWGSCDKNLIRLLASIPVTDLIYYCNFKKKQPLRAIKTSTSTVKNKGYFTQQDLKINACTAVNIMTVFNILSE